MRHVIKSDKDKTERLSSPETQQILIDIILGIKKDLISDSIYRDSYDTEDGKRSKVEDKLAISYKNKCAYCERICKADIEHYRPKKGIYEDPSHPGYYWLCYEWSNLIPSCITCNREGGKHNKFPITGKRAQGPSIKTAEEIEWESFKAGGSPLKDEIPLLLHPEVDFPEIHFGFEIDPNGEGIRMIGKTDRGKETIRICLLNRNELKLDRVEKVIDDFRTAIHCTFLKLENGGMDEQDFVDRIEEHLEILKVNSLNEEKTYTYLRKFIISSAENFENMVIPYLDKKVRKTVLEAYLSAFGARD